MKKYFLLLALVSLSANAQDVIVKKDGSTILSKVLEVNPDDIKYKKFSNQNGPTYTINKSEVMAINYEGGDKDTFDITSTNNTLSQKLINKKPASNNASLVKKYQSEVIFTDKTSKKNAKSFLPIMMVSDSSLMSTDDIEMRFAQEIVYDQNRTFENFLLRYYIKLVNKTDRILFVDLANCFKIENDNSTVSYYEGEQTSVSHGSSSGGAIGLGGVANVLGIGGIAGTLANSVALGGSSQNTAMTTYSQKRILSIPPNATTNLTEFRQVHIDKNNWKTISDLEFWRYSFTKDFVKKFSHISFDENTSPYTVKYIISYSNSQDFSSYSMLYAKLYARFVVGCSRYDYSDFSANSTNGIEKKIKRYMPNYRNGSDILVGLPSHSWR